MKALLTLLCLLPAAALFASIVPEGSGIIYGKDHVFSLQAPKGWVLDNESGVSMGVHAVFYKEGSTWADSRSVAYARSRPLEEGVQTIDDTVRKLIADFHQGGSPDYQGKKVREIETESGKKGVIYHFSGDKWGNFEAVCYFKEEKTINFVVLSCRGKDDFDSSLESFLELSKSYTFISDEYTLEVKEAFEKAKEAEGN